ncbi:hypothetical protein SA3033_00720 [Aggregatibacter actinomycetemcomitans serotype d str. SA3033]|nr:hypothetical protein ANH9381_2168 [Aggregatibacter actinomycetemcomitans ANH9381]KYK72425.1 hypothetical protein SA2149_10040 [Aggregatibacter actinomycetemcomitans serotype e str. SA2149]KYK75748.1 hypothetical protein SA2876_07480 [Aggregatibacter actinomycetemcomitans serotype e str. SA2876]KYK78607.1 hypothetical protein SC383S_08245 [Aggregatibacter actinomycetemcomitans SC383s]KYK84989.1 hypothetical protein SA3033_00720 [Aggregatibacter actinomycetemcomitans serotype d str. SA3033]KY
MNGDNVAFFVNFVKKFALFTGDYFSFPQIKKISVKIID